MKNKKLIIAALSISVLASSAVAQESKPYIIKPFTSKQTFCNVDRFTGVKREYTVKKWDASTQFDVFQDMSEGGLMDTACKNVRVEKRAYCFANSNDCWVEFDPSIISENNKEDLSALRADLAEGAQE